MFLVIDGMRFNEHHITFIEAKESSGANGEFYQVAVFCNPELYKGQTQFRTKRECEEAIDSWLGSDMVDHSVSAAQEVNSSFSEIDRIRRMLEVEDITDEVIEGDFDWDLEDL